MELKDLKTKSAAELQDQLIELRREQFNMRMARGTGQLAKPHELKRVRRDVARVKTLLGAKK